MLPLFLRRMLYGAANALAHCLSASGLRMESVSRTRRSSPLCPILGRSSERSPARTDHFAIIPLQISAAAKIDELLDYGKAWSGTVQVGFSLIAPML
jgi:hypothetical protein